MVKYIFCPQCKSKLDNKGEYPYCKSCDLIIYLGSHPTASILPIDNGRVLLAKRSIEPFKGKYDVIGGFLKHGEDPKVGVTREVKEETNLEVEIGEILSIYIDRYGKNGNYTLNIYYLGKIKGGKIKPGDDVESLKWFPINKLPKPAFKNQIKVFEDLRNKFLEIK